MKTEPSKDESCGGAKLYGLPTQEGDALLQYDLAQRGLTKLVTPDMIAALGFRGIAADEVDATYRVKGFNGVEMPYYGIDGSPARDSDQSAFKRVRLLNFTGKGKYRSRLGSQLHAYLPKLPGLDWSAIASNPKIPLNWTEGEWKTVVGVAKMDDTTGPTIGLGGTGCFSNDGKALPEVSRFKLQGRVCNIIFDAPMNSNVMRDAGSFACILKSKGASVNIINIALTPTYAKHFSPGDKCGLDDYLLHAKSGGWKELLDKDHIIDLEDIVEGADTTLAWALSNLAYLKSDGGDKYIHLGSYLSASESPVRKASAMAADLANKFVKRGEKTAPLFSTWRSNRWRIDLNSIVCEPAHAPRSITPDSNYNIWSGFRLQPKANPEIAAVIKKLVRSYYSSYNPITKLVEQSDEQKMVEEWYWGFHGYLAQRPDLCASNSLVDQSAEEGIGKSLLKEMHQRWMGDTACKVVGSEIFEDWTDFLEGTKYLIANEPSSNADKHRQKMKELRTNPKLKVNHKYGACYSIANIISFGATTNESYAYGISESSRRDLVYSPTWLGQGSYLRLPEGPERRAHEAHFLLAQRVGRAFNIAGDKLGGCDEWGAALMDVLMALDLAKLNYAPTMAAPATAAKSAMALASTSAIVEEYKALAEAMDDMVAENGGVLFTTGTFEHFLKSLGLDKMNPIAAKKYLEVNRIIPRGLVKTTNWMAKGGTLHSSLKADIPFRVWGYGPEHAKDVSTEERKKWFYLPA